MKDKKNNFNNNFKSKFKNNLKTKRENFSKEKNDFQKNILYGINPMKECILQDYSFEKLYLQKKQDSTSQQIFIDYCKKKKIQFFFVEKKFLDEETNFANHQGVMAFLKKGIKKIEELTNFLQKEKQEKQMIILLDQITDPVNVGTITRTSVFFGCRLIILPEKNSCPINEVVHKVSSGASFMIPFYFNNQLGKTIEILKENDFNVYSCSLEEDATDVNEIDFPKKTAIIIGAEGKGIRPHLLKQSDHQISIGKNSFLNSLNAAIATGIILHAVHTKN